MKPVIPYEKCHKEQGYRDKPCYHLTAWSEMLTVFQTLADIATRHTNNILPI